MKKTSLYIVLSIVTLFFLVTILFSNAETYRLRQAYGQEAVNALALDAASVSATVESTSGLHFWPRDTTQCIFRTRIGHVEGNSGHANRDDWPAGDTPSCRDFHSPKHGTFDMSRTNPGNCLPVFTMPNVGGPEMSFLAIVASGATTDALTTVNLSQERRAELAQLQRLPNYYYTKEFIRGGGLDRVSVELIETEQCDGFSIYEFQTEVVDPRSLRVQLSENGYHVGLK